MEELDGRLEPESADVSAAVDLDEVALAITAESMSSDRAGGSMSGCAQAARSSSLRSGRASGSWSAGSVPDPLLPSMRSIVSSSRAVAVRAAADFHTSRRALSATR